MARVPLDVTLRTANGTAVPSTTLYVYDRGTTDEVTLYDAESAGSTVTQPVTSDSEGRFPDVWVAPGSYDLYAPNDTVEQTQHWEAVVGADIAVTNEAPINVKHSDYGAVGNGSTNDSAAIQAAIDALPAAGGEVYFPPGSYICNVLLDSGTVLRGSGISATTLKSAASGGDVLKGRNFATLTGTAVEIPEERGDNLIEISDLSIDGNKANNTAGWGIRVWGCSHNWQNLYVKNCKSGGIWTEFTTITDPASYDTPEEAALDGRFIHIKTIDNDGNGWTFKGPHDSRIEHYDSYSNTGWALEALGDYCSMHGAFWNAWMNDGGSFYFEQAPNLSHCVASSSGVGIELGSGAGTARMTGMIIGGHDYALILRGTQHLFDGEIHGANAADGYAVNVDGASKCHVRILGNDNKVGVKFTSEGSANQFIGILGLGSGQTLTSGTPSSTNLILLQGTNDGGGIANTTQFPSGTLKAAGWSPVLPTSSEAMIAADVTSATTLGTVVKKLPVVTKNGTTQGYIPVYNTIT